MVEARVEVVSREVEMGVDQTNWENRSRCKLVSVLFLPSLGSILLAPSLFGDGAWDMYRCEAMVSGKKAAPPRAGFAAAPNPITRRDRVTER